jgi:hypothetical protein
MAFPTSPTNGQIATVNGIRYSYNSTTRSWTRISNAKITTAAAAPSNPALGDQWYNTNLDILFEYINDGTTSYWIDIQTLGSVAVDLGIGPTVLQGNITVSNSNVYSIGTSSGYVRNIFANSITANNITVQGNIVPSANITYNLGSTNYRFKDLFLSGTTIDLGGATIKTDSNSGAIALIPQPTSANPNPTGIVVSPTGAISTVTTSGGQVSGNAIGNSASSSATQITGVSVGKSIAMSMVFGG